MKKRIGIVIDTNFGHADDSASRAMSQLWELNKAEYAAYEDLDAFGGSCCGGLVSKSFNLKREAIPKEALKRAFASTTDRWAYFNGMDYERGID